MNSQEKYERLERFYRVLCHNIDKNFSWNKINRRFSLTFMQPIESALLYCIAFALAGQAL